MNYNIEKDFLPLGSVVLLKNAKKSLVVIGYSIVTEDGKVWDYLGCAYPIGVVSTESNLLFNAKQIDKVIFEGYSDEEGDKFRKKISLEIGMSKDE